VYHSSMSHLRSAISHDMGEWALNAHPLYLDQVPCSNLLPIRVHRDVVAC